MSKTAYDVHVNYNSEIKGNFVRLPPTIAQTLWMSGSPIQSFKFRLGSNFYISWDGLESNTDGAESIELNPLLAKTLHLPLGHKIELHIEQIEEGSNIFIEEVHVKPLTSDDWEIAELNSGYLQNTILTQTKLVSKGGIIVCSIGNMSCSFRIVEILPKHLTVGLLHEGSLVIIEPKERGRGVKHTLRNTSYKVLPPQTKRGLCWNLFEESTFEFWETLIYLPDDEVNGEIGILSVILPKGSDLINDKVKFGDDRTIPVVRRVAVNVKKVSEHFSFRIPSGHVLLTPYVWNLLGLKADSHSSNNGTQFQLSFVEGFQALDKGICAKLYHTIPEPKSETSKEQSESELEMHLKCKFCILTNHSLLTTDRDKIFVEISDCWGNQIDFIPACSPITTIENIKFVHFYDTKYLGDSAHFESALVPSTSEFLTQPVRFIEYNDNVKKIVEELTFPMAYSPAILVEGEYGMGKTTLVQRVSSVLISKYKYHTIYVDCERINDPFNFEKLRDFFGLQVIDRAYWHRPSVIILDNADFIFGFKGASDGGNTAHNAEVSLDSDSGYSRKVTEFLLQRLNLVNSREDFFIKVVFSCSKGRNLSKKLYESHLIGETWTLKPLNTKERSLFLEGLMESNKLILDPSSLEVRDIALETEGYSPADLTKLIQTLTYSYGFSKPVSFKDFQRIKEKFTPIFLQNAGLANFDNKTLKQKYEWEQIGGLDEAKRLVLETLEWPVKYSAIFKSCPLRLRSGILIYGYPGCGKTLLANTVAAQCNLHFISVKGPEVLNKYIGASEENIRTLFERAQAVKPCVLFFDEFESIAARRGHDSTGVTDRVVNQLLTQMDGVEGLDGVFVMAATSRPDLLDPALLRPGRLDKSVFCDLPDESERLDILSKHWRNSFFGNVQFESDTEEDTIVQLLREVARLTTGFSGADLQRVCYNGYLKGIHRKLDVLNDDTGNSSRMTKESGITGTTTSLQFSTINVLNDDANEVEFLKAKLGRLLENDVAGVDSTGEIDSSKESEGEKLHGCEKSSSSSTSATGMITIKPEDVLESCRETNPSISVRERARLSAIYESFRKRATGQPTEGTADENYGTSPIGVRLSLM